MKDSSRALLRDGTDLLARLDATTRESSQLTTRVRVDRLLESACPGIGRRWWDELRDAYEVEVQDDRHRRDDAWDELFALECDVSCDCDFRDDADDHGFIRRVCHDSTPREGLPLYSWFRTTNWNEEVRLDPELGHATIPIATIIDDCPCESCRPAQAHYVIYGEPSAGRSRVVARSVLVYTRSLGDEVWTPIGTVERAPSDPGEYCWESTR